MSKRGLVLGLALIASISSVAQASDMVKWLCGADKNMAEAEEPMDYNSLRDHYFNCPNCLSGFKGWFEETSLGRSQDAVFCPTLYEALWGLVARKRNGD